MIRNTDNGARAFLRVLFGQAPKMTEFLLQCITDDLPIGDGDDVNTHTVASGGGYMDRAFVNDAEDGMENGIATSVWNDITLTFTGPLDGNRAITGYVVLYGGTMLFGEKYEIPFQPSFNGEQLVVTPKYKYGNGNPA